MAAPLFVTGTARSGTNLVARMLDAHPEVSVACDPYFPLFHSLRNARGLRVHQEATGWKPVPQMF